MKIVIFGASGRTGQHLISQALEQGHTVTAFARTPGKIKTSHERLKIIRGDIHDADAVDLTVEGQEVVVCTLGVNKDGPATALADGTRNIIHAMKKHGVRRILNVSAAGFSGERADFLTGKILLWIFNRYLTKLFTAMKNQHEVIEQSGLEWIAIRPFLLDEGPSKGGYRIVLEGIPSRGYRINTGDVAEFMLNNLESNQYMRKFPAIAY
ncbi:MAG: SDR family oxidoreductase [Anaerolineales bacterium]|nr:SDR family oxidoreductase [Anaerolineales bacterium]